MAKHGLVAFIAVVGPAKTVVDQIQETDKLVSDALDKLEQARAALQTLQDRLKQQDRKGEGSR